MWLVIGYGNSLMSDDRFGLEVCRELKSYAVVKDLAEIIIAHQLTPEVSELVSRAGNVIFVDASVDLAPGELRFIPLDSTLDQNRFNKPMTNSLFSHHCTLQTVLSEAQELYGRAPQGWLCTVGGAHFELGEELSPLVNAIIPKAVQLILKKMDACYQYNDN